MNGLIENDLGQQEDYFDSEATHLFYLSNTHSLIIEQKGMRYIRSGVSEDQVQAMTSSPKPIPSNMTLQKRIEILSESSRSFQHYVKPASQLLDNVTIEMIIENLTDAMTHFGQTLQVTESKVGAILNTQKKLPARNEIFKSLLQSLPFEGPNTIDLNRAIGNILENKELTYKQALTMQAIIHKSLGSKASATYRDWVEPIAFLFFGETGMQSEEYKNSVQVGDAFLLAGRLVRI